MKGISALMGRNMRELASSLCSLPYEEKTRCPSVNQKEDFHQEPSHAGPLISDFQPPDLRCPASITVRNESFPFQPPHLWDSVLAR